MEKPPPFRFLEPFSGEVWVYVVLTSLVVAFYVSFLNKLSPYDYHGRFVYVDSETQEKEWVSIHRRANSREANSVFNLGSHNSFCVQLLFKATEPFLMPFDGNPSSAFSPLFCHSNLCIKLIEIHLRWDELFNTTPFCYPPFTQDAWGSALRSSA